MNSQEELNSNNNNRTSNSNSSTSNYKINSSRCFANSNSKKSSNSTKSKLNKPSSFRSCRKAPNTSRWSLNSRKRMLAPLMIQGIQKCTSLRKKLSRKTPTFSNFYSRLPKSRKSMKKWSSLRIRIKLWKKNWPPVNKISKGFFGT